MAEFLAQSLTEKHQILWSTLLIRTLRDEAALPFPLCPKECGKSGFEGMAGAHAFRRLGT